MAKSGIFRVHCVARAEPWGPSFFTELEKLFLEVCGHPASAFGDASVYWWTDRPVHHLANEPIVWLVASKDDSLILEVYKKKVKSSSAGATFPGGQGTISEIYLDHKANQGSGNQAKMAFHELMHNKLLLGDELHGKTFGLGRELLDLSSAFSASLTADDIRLMAPALEKPIPQWVPAFK